MLYFFNGSSVRAAGQNVAAHSAIALRYNQDVTLENGADMSAFVSLQGRRIGEPVVQYGPFVMNTAQEIEQT